MSNSDTNFEYVLTQNKKSYEVKSVNCDISGVIRIPDSYDGKPITGICEGAFKDCTKLTSITIPNSITSIGEDAFLNTWYYNNVANWENGVLYIGKYLIKAKEDISSFYSIKYGTLCIADSAFSGCDELTNITIPDSVTNIGSSVFEGCTGLTSITIGNAVTSIGSYAFDDTGYYDNEANWENRVLYIGKYLIKAKEDISGSYYVKEGTLGIADSAFGGYYSDYTELTSVTIPNSVTSIGRSAFSSCKGLTSITIGNGVASIGDYTFHSCTELKSVTIGNSVISIGSCAFFGCTGLTSITIPNNVTNIGDHAFSGCTRLTSVTIPNSVTSIDNGVFYGCTGLTSVTIPDSVTSIGEDAFSGCTGLKDVYISDIASWCKIDFASSYSNPLRYTHNLYLNGTLVTELIIPDGVTSIGDYAFYECTGLTSVTIPNSVTSIGECAFTECVGLTSISVSSENTEYKSIDGNLYSKDGKTLIQYACGKTDTSFTIPNSVTSIGERVFQGCSGLTSITIPNSVTSIGNFAFFGTGYYKNEANWKNGLLYIGKYLIKAKDDISGCSVKDGTLCIADDAFMFCFELTNITIPDSVTSIAYGLFKNTEYHSNKANWENGVLYIGKYLIEAKEDISGSYVIKDGTLCIADYAFSDCEELTSITIPNSVTNIGNHAFWDCTGLTSVTIGNGVTNIGESAFSGCTGLTGISVPDSVINIGDDAFGDCGVLQKSRRIEEGYKEVAKNVIVSSEIGENFKQLVLNEIEPNYLDMYCERAPIPYNFPLQNIGSLNMFSQKRYNFQIRLYNEKNWFNNAVYSITEKRNARLKCEQERKEARHEAALKFLKVLQLFATFILSVFPIVYCDYFSILNLADFENTVILQVMSSLNIPSLPEVIADIVDAISVPIILAYTPLAVWQLKVCIDNFLDDFYGFERGLYLFYIIVRFIVMVVLSAGFLIFTLVI